MKRNHKGFVLFVVLAFGRLAAQACVPPPAGLVSWWPLEEGSASDVADANPGVVLSGSSVAGKVGDALSAPQVDIPDSPNLRMNNPFTIEGWVLTPTTGSYQMILIKGGQQFVVGGGCPCNYDLQITPTGEALFEVRAATLTGGQPMDSAVVFSASQVADGTFHHVAGVFDGTTASLYVDGVLEGQDESKAALFLADGVITSPDPVNLGYYDHLFNGPSSFFQGILDEISIYDRALLAAEIQAIRDAGGAGKCQAREVGIDVKPGSFPNSVNPRSQGKIPVAILSTAAFDATTVDPATIRFGATGTEAAPAHLALEDVEGDGDTDLILHFDTGATGIRCGDTSAALSAATFGGQRIFGVDSIRTVGCK